MPAHSWPWLPAATRRARYCRYLLGPVLLSAALLTQGCTPPPPLPFAGTDASDPDVRVPPAVYRAAVRGYSSQRPVEPAPWRERNDGVVPPPKKGGQ